MVKKNIAILCFLSITYVSLGQMHISTDLREDFSWNSRTEDWDLQNQDEDELTFFDFNKGFTLFKHTTTTITSSYKISSYVQDKDNKRWEFEIVSDVGNKYLMILDISNNNIRFIGKGKSVYLVRHRIKRLWFDD